MRIWKLKFEVDEYDNFEPVIPLKADIMQSFDGRSHLKNWKPISVRRMEPEKDLPLGDAPGFIIPVFSKRALDELIPLIKNSIEVLPLCYEEEYFGINVTNVIDVIDYSKSEYRTFSDKKRIMVIEKYEFILSDELLKSHIFKIVDEPRRSAFVSDEFKQTVEKNELLGFKFKLVWDSEQE